MSYFDKIKKQIKQDGGSVSNETHLQQKAMKRIIKNNEIHTAKARALSDLCITPGKNEQWRIITEKQFNAYAFILHILSEGVIESLHLAIYRINQPTVASLIDLIESGKIKKATFVISNFFNQTKKPEKWAIKLKEFAAKNKNVKHVYTHNHSKVVCIKSFDGNFFVFEGSGNMSDNARIEQYLFENCEETYKFHTGWMESLI